MVALQVPREAYLPKQISSLTLYIGLLRVGWNAFGTSYVEEVNYIIAVEIDKYRVAIENKIIGKTDPAQVPS